MTADPDLDPPGPDEQRAALRHIIQYRHLRRHIRASGTGALVWGGLMLLRWYLVFFTNKKGGQPLAVLHLCLAVGELAAGVWKKLFPVPEAFILDGLVLLGFAAANAWWTYQERAAGKRLDLFGVVLAVWMFWAGVSQFVRYRDLLRARFRRPGADQLRWFDELLAETRAADPEADPNSLDLPTDPPVRVKLLGDLALVLSPGDDDPAVVARHDLRIDREAPAPGERLPTGFLTVDGRDAGDFALDDYNWRNYAAWKTAGGDPPPPLVALPQTPGR